MNIGVKREPIVEDSWQKTINKSADQKHIFKKKIGFK